MQINFAVDVFTFINTTYVNKHIIIFINRNVLSGLLFLVRNLLLRLLHFLFCEEKINFIYNIMISVYNSSQGLYIIHIIC